jgi:acyl-coenzyme A thioesterase PaaI-like protein
MNPDSLLAKARNSKFYLWLLNLVLNRTIPFNGPHGIRILAINSTEVSTLLPFWRINKNHIGGMHACALATAAEFTSGIALINALGSKNYRLIMQSMQVKYHMQGKKNCIINYKVEAKDLIDRIAEAENESMFETCVVQVHNESQQLVCTAEIRWQIKAWSRVKKIA